MSIPNTSEKSTDLNRQENLTKGNVSVKKVALYSYDSSTDTINPVNDVSKTSTANSTTTPLGINGTFAGSWEDVTNYAEVIVSVYVLGTNASSLTDGLKVEWSSDGITKHGEDLFTISANSDKTFSFPCQRKYVRVVYQNDGIAQTSFNLQTLLKVRASKGSSHRLKDALVQEDDAIVTKSLIAGFSTAGGGSLVNVKVNPSGSLQVSGDLTVTQGTYESRNDTTTDANLVYLGKALPGSLEGDAAWQIKRYNKSAGHMSFADDVTTFTKVWADRTTYNY